MNKQVMIGSVDFSENLDMYDSLVKAKDTPGYISKREYLIFDNDNHIVWIFWYERN